MPESGATERFKLAAIATLLAHRREHPALFESGGYEPLSAEGPDADQICGFLRSQQEDVLLAAVARFPARLAQDGVAGASGLAVPDRLQQTSWYDLLCGRRHPAASILPAAELFSVMPAAVLVPDPAPGSANRASVQAPRRISSI